MLGELARFSLQIPKSHLLVWIPLYLGLEILFFFQRETSPVQRTLSHSKKSAFFWLGRKNLDDEAIDNVRTGEGGHEDWPDVLDILWQRASGREPWTLFCQIFLMKANGNPEID